MRIIIHRFFYFASVTVLLISAFAFAFVCTARAQTSKSAINSPTRRNRQSKPPGAGETIVPGTNVRQVKLGDTVDEIFKKYPKLSRENYYPASGDCLVTELTLPNSLNLYLTDGRVSQIKVEQAFNSATIATAEGIKPGSAAALVKKYYPNANRAYTKLDGASASIGYAPPIFWVGRQAGIAFEFSTEPRGGRVVYRIHVFTPNGKMLFGGPCDQDTDLRELPPFATEVPEKMIKDYENNSGN